MKYHWIHRAHQPRLTLFFAGWGMDATPFEHLQPVDSDLLLCADYRSLEFDPSVWQGYEEMRVVAWSMGVWAASVVLPRWAAAAPSEVRTLPRWVDSVAINGTPMPVDDRYGIPEAIFRGTLEGLDVRHLEKFYRRMCVTRESLSFFLAHRPQRTVNELRDELQAIGEAAWRSPQVQEMVAAPCSPQVRETEAAFDWRRSLVGSRDLIFPSDSQQAAWEQLRQGRSCPVVEVIDEPHYTARITDELTRPWPVSAAFSMEPFTLVVR